MIIVKKQKKKLYLNYFLTITPMLIFLNLNFILLINTQYIFHPAIGVWLVLDMYD